MVGFFLRPLPIQHTYNFIVLQPFDDSIDLDGYQDDILLSEDSALIETNLFDAPLDIDFEPADETIERDVSLVPYQHYSPPSE